MILLNTILVATDFSEPSEAALTYGRELARNFGARLVVLHVAGNIVAFGGGDGAVVIDPEVQSQVEAGARERLESLISDEDREQLRASTALLISNATPQAITSYAKETKVDLIVMGTHGREGVMRVVLGSVAETVVRRAPCPVLTVHQPERELVMAREPVRVGRGATA